MISGSDQNINTNASENILESRMLFDFFEQAPGIFAVLKNSNHIFEFANAAYIELIGNRNPIGKTVAEVLPEVSEQGFIKLLDDVYTTGETYNGHEIPISLIRGQNIPFTEYINFTYQVFKNDQNEIAGILVSGYVVTEQVTARQLIEEKEEQIRFALEAGEMGTFDYYPQSGELIWSAKAKELFGLAPEAAVNYELYLNALHPDDRASNDLLFLSDQFFDQDRHFETVYRSIGISDNKIRWVRSKGKVTVNDKGEPVRISGVMQDATREKMAEEDLKRFKHMAENAIDPFILMRRDGTFAYLNAVAVERWGYSKEEIKNIRVPDVDPIFNDEVFRASFDAAQNGTIHKVETLHKRKDGSIYPVEVHMAGLTLNGTPHMFAMARDISERKKAEEILKYRTALLEAQSDAIPDALLIVDGKGKIISFNNHFIDLWKIPEDIIKRNDDSAALQFAMTQLEDPQSFIERVQYCYQHQEESAHEEVLFKDGRVIDRYGFSIKAEGEESYGWAWYFRDITERKNFEKSLLESEKRFRLMADSMPQKVWTADAASQVNYFNKRWLDYTQLSFDELRDQGWDNIIHPDDLAASLQALKESFENSKDCEIEHRILRYDGTYRWHLSRGHARTDSDGNLKGWIGTNTDIHDQKLFAEELKKQISERIKLEKQKNDFISMASHELKTPVTSIKGYTQFLQNKLAREGNTEAVSFLSRINNQVNKLTSLISDLLDATKVTGGRLQYDLEIFDFNNLVMEVADEMKQTSLSHSIICNLDSTQNILGDRIRIGQVMINLISNALKYSPKANRIVLSTKLNHDEISFSVQDFGIGISAENQKQVFDQFFRVSGEVVSQYAGMGLGLYISCEIVKRHQGRLDVQSEEGEGSIFTFTLPLTSVENI
ncbi:PAS domain-containing sensor histidine kinase [Daejeonella oryzae]|uniref:PAS domain-containing sensor histidine kinase n=1 Tax=Daejeonella oryzae TaxID=1122943 RepID=UPI0003F9B724|nr:PAS domain-containing sensor histidine kinase [Daejeonella oryzae]